MLVFVLDLICSSGMVVQMNHIPLQQGFLRLFARLLIKFICDFPP